MSDPHVRVQLRQAVFTALDALPGLHGKVFTNRATPLQTEELPAVLLLVSDEKIVRESTGAAAARQLSRTTTIQIDIVGAIANGFDDALEGIAAGIEIAFGVDAPLGDFAVKDFLLAGVSKGHANGDAESDMMVLRLEYAAWLMTSEADPTTLT